MPTSNDDVKAPPRFWEDAPESVRQIGKEKAEKQLLEVQTARKYFRCEVCGAPKGELCDGDEGDTHTAWRRLYDLHLSRVRRWTEATELEKAMLLAVYDDEM